MIALDCLKDDRNKRPDTLKQTEADKVSYGGSTKALKLCRESLQMGNL